MSERYRPEDLENAIEIQGDADLTFGHVDINMIREKGIVSEQLWHEFYKFCFVRNPWERIVSLYEYLNRGESFDTFVLGLGRADPIGFYNVKGLSQCRPQTDWIPRDIDFIGRFENLESDVKKICEITERSIIGGKLPHILPVNPKTGKRKKRTKHYREYFSDSSSGRIVKEIIEEFYQKDFQRFDYTFLN
jgi:hypothetical protein